MSAILALFEPKETYFYRVRTREQFTQLLSYAKSPKFNKKTIVLEYDISLTDKDLCDLTNALSNNPAARRTLSSILLRDHPTLTVLPDFSAFRLTYLHVSRCGLIDFPDISKYVHLKEIYISDWKTAGTLNLQNNQELESFYVAGGLFSTALDFSANSKLERIQIYACGLVTPPRFDPCPKLKYLNLNANGLKDPPNLEFNPLLERVELDRNRLVAAPEVAHCSRLTRLFLQQNKIKKLPKLPSSLISLYAEDNEIDEIQDVSNCKRLKDILMQHNKITDAEDFSKCKRLARLNFAYNPLLTLGARVILMQFERKAEFRMPFEEINNWPGVRHSVIYDDFQLLAKQCSGLSRKQQKLLWEQSSFAIYKLRYFAAIVELILSAKAYDFEEPGILKKILSYCVAEPRQWMDENIKLLRLLFQKNPAASAVIDKYVASFAPNHQNLNATVVMPQIRQMIFLAKGAAYRNRDSKAELRTRLEPQVKHKRFGWSRLLFA